MDGDWMIRQAAFDWLNEQTEFSDEVFSRETLMKGFKYRRNRITLLGPKGIWKPKQMYLPLSITTIPMGPYHDSFDERYGLLNYRFRGTNPDHPDNVGLRELMHRNTPLIYFHRVLVGKYLATWPVFITDEVREELTFLVGVDEKKYTYKTVISTAGASKEEYTRRSYITTNFKHRIHQRSFRERVLIAYRDTCAICKLRYRELLDAAHIIPDVEEKGLPVVKNGISLCKIHHAAFDNNILGITPDFIVKIREDILSEHDGPMLRYGLQELDNQKLILPDNKHEWPDRDNLFERYDRFLKAG